MLDAADADVPAQACERRQRVDEVRVAAEVVDRVHWPVAQRLDRDVRGHAGDALGELDDLGHHATSRMLPTRTTLGQANSWSTTSGVDAAGLEAEHLAGHGAVGETAAVHELDDVLGDGRAEQMAQLPGDGPLGAEQRQRHPLAAHDGLGDGDGVRSDDVQRLVEPVGGSGHERSRCVAVFDDRERRVGEHAERHDRLAQQATERAGHVLAQHGRQAQLADGDAHAAADVAGRLLDVGQHAAVLGGGVQRCVLGGASGRAAVAAVHLDAAAHHHALERRALGGGADDGGGGVGGELAGVGQPGAGVGFPHAEVDEHVRVERR